MNTLDSGLTVRDATARDAECIHRMIQSLARSVGMGQYMRSTVEDIRRFGFSEPPCFHALIAERAGEAVGLCIYFFSFSSWMGCRGVYVQDLWVDNSQRGNGLGRRLIGETARRAGEQGAAFMRLSVDGENVAAQRFYSNIGLEYADHECIFKAVGERFEALKQLN